MPFKKKKNQRPQTQQEFKTKRGSFQNREMKSLHLQCTVTNPWRLLAWGDVGTNFQARKSQKWNYKVLKVWGLIWVQNISLFKNTRFNLPLQTSLENPMALPKGPLFKVSWSYLLLFRNKKNIAYESPGAQSPRGEAKEINFLFWIFLDSGFQFCDLISSKPWLQLTSLFSLRRA